MNLADFVFRPYRAADEAAVLALFRSNLDPYFLEAEAADLLKSLRQESAYFVAAWAPGTARAGQLAASGGYARNDPYAVLTWGMVERSLHGQGLGRAFTKFRLAECQRAYPGVAIEIGTSQHTEGFYHKLGFRTLFVHPNEWGPGLHHVHMLLSPEL